MFIDPVVRVDSLLIRRSPLLELLAYPQASWLPVKMSAPNYKTKLSAMKVLKSRLFDLEMEKRKAENEERESEKKEMAGAPE